MAVTLTMKPMVTTQQAGIMLCALVNMEFDALSEADDIIWSAKANALCEHGMSAINCGGPQHWYDPSDYNGRFF